MPSRFLAALVPAGPALPQTATSALPQTAASALPQTAATLPPQLQQQLSDYAQQAPRTAFALHFPWATRIFAGLFIFSSVLLIVLLALRSSKQEGLSGSAGGRFESRRPQPGLEGQLSALTGWAASLFVISATLVSMTGF